jgi:hypothetical protein
MGREETDGISTSITRQSQHFLDSFSVRGFVLSYTLTTLYTLHKDRSTEIRKRGVDEW